MNDYKLNLSNIRIDREKGFDIETKLPRNLPYINSFWNSITYEMSLSRLSYTRTVYSYLDLLRDIGGLFSAIAPVFAIIVGIF